MSAPPYLRYRVFFTLGLFFLFFVAVFLRALRIQVIDGGRYARLAQAQHTWSSKLKPQRGDIYDRNGEELAVSIWVDSVYVHPRLVESRERTAAALASLLSMERRRVRRLIDSERPFVWIKRQVDLDRRSLEVISSLPGVGVRKESRRFYPAGGLGANVIGFTGVDAKGLEGIELYHDSTLGGAPVRLVGSRDARGRPLLTSASGRTAGLDLVLTLDRTVQYITEKALADALSRYGAKAATAVVMDPFTGEVLAMAASPGFDPNDFGGYGPDRWRNRAVTDIFEPGSILKPFLLAAVLEEGVMGPHDLVYCENGRYRVADRVFHDLKRFGWLSLEQVIRFSSNIGAAKVGEMLGGRRLYRYLRRFGFGEKTGIELPGEAAGMLRHYRRWSAVTVDTVSFGQGISVTALQMAAAVSALANGGYLMEPLIVKALRDRDGRVVRSTAPRVRRRVVSEATARKVAEILVGVTRPGGTGTLAAIEGFEVAGKTGTAQKPDLERGGYRDDAYVASFIGFVPARAPRLAVVVAIDEPQETIFGGSVAAPVFREIASQSLAYLGVFPETEAKAAIRTAALTAAGGDTRRDRRYEVRFQGEDGERVVPDFRGKTMRMALRESERLGVRLELRGSGRAVTQLPPPGAPLSGEGPVTVTFR
ncbi:MAG TPA: penicillin-binding protein [Deltaproteobacteria bacterium]|nr:penicillin-binding protein [Deltaproteobacteria bacterium]